MQTICDGCLERFEFPKSEIYYDEVEECFFVDCPGCGEINLVEEEELTDEDKEEILDRMEEGPDLYDDLEEDLDEDDEDDGF